MDDPTAARRAFLHAQLAQLEPLGFVVVGLPEPPFDAIQARRESDETFVVEIASRDASLPFSDDETKALTEMGFVRERETLVAPPVTGPDAAADLVERVLTSALGVDAMTPIDIRHGTLRDERAAEEKLAAMRAFIEPVLEEMFGAPPTKDPDGDYVLDVGQLKVFVAPRAVPGRPAIIRVFAITNADLNLSADLGLFLARLNFSLAFGRFSIDIDHRAVWFDETLLGDQVTKDELVFVVNVVAETAAEWDDKIAAMFGGRFREDVPAGASPEAGAKPGQGGYL